MTNTEIDYCFTREYFMGMIEALYFAEASKEKIVDVLSGAGICYEEFMCSEKVSDDEVWKEAWKYVYNFISEECKAADSYSEDFIEEEI
jgi:hypothetical protein